MKIVFLCSSLESGRDGVGDYTLQLGLELIKQGHFVAVIALNDKFITSLYNSYQQVDSYEIPVLRIPATCVVKTRIEEAKNYISKFNPDLLSLQFVIFGYHPKGLPFGIEKQLKLIADGKPWHIMFHEIWTGITKLSPLKHKIIGFFQRSIIKSIVTELNPQWISTSNCLYQLILKKTNISANVLALFSNIPVIDLNLGRIREINEDLYFKVKSEKNRVIGIFGSLYPGTDFTATISEQLQIAENHEKQLIFLSFGRLGAGGLIELEKIKKHFKNVTFFILGELFPNQISTLFQILDLGISCTPKEHLGKSGVFAAMKLHNINIIAPLSDQIPEYEIEIKKYNEYLFSRAQYKWSVEYCAKSFIKLVF